MKLSIVLCFLGVVAVSLAARKSYTDRYDNLDLDEILSNRRMLLPYLKCALDLGRCPPEGLELKANIRGALEENCAKCTEKQRLGARKVIAHLINNENDYWKQLVAKYDPNNKFTRKYEKELKNIKKN